MESSFLDYLKKGEFVVPRCTKCGKKSWPPTLACSECFGKTMLKKVKKTGIIIEFSMSYVRDCKGVFGVIEMEGFRLVGSLENEKNLHVGMEVKMDKCGVNAQDGRPFYHFVSLNK